VGRLDALVDRFRETISIPWSTGIADAQRVIFLVYEPVDELKMRLKLGEFELVASNAGHPWHQMDLTDAFPRWLGGHEYRDSYFEDPGLFLRDQRGDITDFHESIVKDIRREAAAHAAKDSVFAIFGVGSLFGFTHVSRLVEDTKRAVPGRYIAFFPGDCHDNNYRLLDARDGWNYLAMAITAAE
jgi:hypothetical protein